MAPEDARRDFLGLLHELGERARSATYDHGWQRDAAVWTAVVAALDGLAAGRRPATPRETPPSWLPALVRRALSQAATRTSWRDPWPPVRALEQLGAVVPDVDDTYILAVVGGLGAGRAGGRARALREDVELRERVVWRMFEVEGGGEVSLANVDKFTPLEDGWSSAFQEIVADGTLDRGRVLSSCLEALRRDFSAYRAGWFGRLFDALSPTDDELVLLQPLLRPLLRSQVKATVSLALRHLRTLSKQRLLDDASTVAALGPALTASAKSSALAATRLLEDIAKRGNVPAAELVAAGTSALAHPLAEVQGAAARLLVVLGAADLVAEAGDQLAPSVRAEHSAGTPHAVPGRPDTPPTTVPDPVAESLSRANQADLLDLFAALLEDAGDPVQVERALAGLAEHGADANLAPLRRRAAAVLSRGPREGVTRGWLRGHLARLVLVTLGERRPELPMPYRPADFLVSRLTETAEVVRGRLTPRTLLATPDTSDGWLSAETLVRRLVAGAASPAPYDVVAALLRVHPAGREGALRLLHRAGGRLPAELGAVVTYALGGDLPDPPRPPRPELWVAASRSRSPFGPDEQLARVGVTGAGRDRPIDARVRLEGRPYPWRDSRGEHTHVSWAWAVDVTDAATSASLPEPTAVAAVPLGHGRYDGGAEDYVGWAALVYPHDADHFLVHELDPVLVSTLHGEVRHDAARVLTALGRHPGRLGRLAGATLAAGLAAPKVVERVAAVDAVVGLRATGQLCAQLLARGLGDLRGPGLAARWAGALRDVAAVSPLDRDLVIDSLTAALPELDPSSRGLNALLGLLHEELLRGGRRPPVALEPWLDRFAGSSNAARAARKLQELTHR